MTSPHAAFVDARKFLDTYLADVDRLLQEITDALADRKPAWRRLRPYGTQYLTNHSADPGEESLIPWYLWSFYAPTELFSSTYGVPAEKIARLAFVGAQLGDDAEPAIYLGWFAQLGRTGKIEPQLRELVDWCDEDYLVPPSPRWESLDDAWPSPVALRSEDEGTVDEAGGMVCSLVRAPMALLTSAADAKKLAARLHAAICSL